MFFILKITNEIINNFFSKKTNTMKNFIILSLFLCILFSCQEEQKKLQNTDNQVLTKQIPTWKTQNSATDVSLRGLAAVSEKVAWASGSKGMITHTSDGGQTWQADSILGYSDLQFRDIEAFDANTAIVLSAGSPAKIFKTKDGGKTWQEKYHNEQEGIFFDAMAFWDEQNGIAFSDPIDGKLFVIRTEDRNGLIQYLAKCEIQTLIHYPIAPHKQECFKEWNALSFPITEKIHEEVVSLPLNSSLSDEQVSYVIEKMNKY